jgi:hypothetical protein
VGAFEKRAAPQPHRVKILLTPDKVHFEDSIDGDYGIHNHVFY